MRPSGLRGGEAIGSQQSPSRRGCGWSASPAASLADAARHSKFTDKLRAHLESLPTEHADTETLKGALVALLPQVRKRSQRRRLRPPPFLTVRPHRWMVGLPCVVVDHSLNVDHSWIDCVQIFADPDMSLVNGTSDAGRRTHEY